MSTQSIWVKMSEKKCLGCGATLQNEDPSAIGYTPKLEMDYCQRCFRMIHYDKHTDTEIKPLDNLDKLKKVKGTFVWIMDIMDLETSLNSKFMDFFREHYCHVILNKCDLLPETVTIRKITDYVARRLKNQKIRVIDIICRGFENDFKINFEKKIARDADNGIVMVGVSNVGKSTVINELLGKDVLTVNRHPSTTLTFNEINSDYGKIIDTVGLVDGNSVQAYLSNSDLKKVIPYKTVRPAIYQLRDSQTISIGGLVRIDIHDCEKATVVAYVSTLCPVQRNNQKNADKLWQNHFGRDLRPILKNSKSFEEYKITDFPSYKEKRDICIEGLGWVCLSGNYSHVSVYADERIKIRNRKAMI
ncbi:MAG: 50S ribosome-binding GTPase [Erysipelotrichaceae bacterium]|nr:50S ribosome-binding GTPase [Erysipelotrichaceae bacterium]